VTGEILWGAQMGFYLDWIGPTVLCALVMTVLFTIMIVAFIQIFAYKG
jgi:hypothetical protein